MAKKNQNSSLIAKILNHYVIKSILIQAVVAIVIFFGTLVTLRIYTSHGEALSVPDVREMILNDAGKLLQSKQMRWQLSDSVYVNSIMPGAVVNQSPEPGAKVKKNRNVFLTINALAPEKVKMPYVVGVTFRQAKSMLELQGLVVGDISYIPDIAQNNVLKQMFRGEEIRRGTEIVKGSEIDLVLGQGLSNEVTSVPYLLGNTLPGGREAMTQHFLNYGVIIYDQSVVTSADTINAFIYLQRPAASDGAMLRLGSSIDVWMTVDETKKPDFIEVNDD